MAHRQRAKQLRAAAVCLIGSARSIILTVAAAAAAAAAVGGDETPIHDPSGIVIEGAHAFIFSTSYMPEGGIELRRTNYTGRGDADLEHVVWEKHTTVFPAGASPAWVHHRVPQVIFSRIVLKLAPSSPRHHDDRSCASLTQRGGRVSKTTTHWGEQSG